MDSPRGFWRTLKPATGAGKQATHMIDMTRIDELAARLAAALPPGARQVGADMEAQFRQLLLRAFARMDLVTREEFDIQKGVLERTQLKLEQLQQQREQLENS
jgi:BMFP domain-containing protein YqiC